MSHSEVEFTITPTVVDGCRVFVLEGELDAAQAPTLTAALDHCTGGLPVIVDLTALTFLDSSGIHALLRDGVGDKPAALVRSARLERWACPRHRGRTEVDPALRRPACGHPSLGTRA